MVFLNMNGRAFLIHKIFMRFGGVWPQDGRNRGSAVTFAALSILQIAVIIALLADGHGTSFPQRLKTIISLSNAFASQVALRVNGDRMISLIDSTIDDWSATTDPTEREIMRRHNKLGRLLFSVVIAYFVVIHRVRSAMAVPVFRKVVSLIGHRQTETFAFNDAIQALGIVIGVFTNVIFIGGALFYWSVAMHLSGQFKIVKSQIQTFLSVNDKKSRRREFRRLVNRHGRLLDLTNELERSFNLFVALRVVNTQVMDCIKAYHLGVAINAGNYERVVALLVYLFLSLWRLSLYYNAGDYLTGCSEEIVEVFTQCNWYELPKDTIVSFSIVIMRSRMPKTLTAYKVFRLNRSNFKYMINTLYSYVSLIVSISRARELRS